MENGLLFRLERDGYPVPAYEISRWTDQQRVVLDHDNHPLRDFTILPKTLSSNVEGWLIEMYVRMDTRISHADIRARMPSSIFTSQGSKPLISLSAIAMRLNRFREEHGIPAWKNRDGRDYFLTYVKGLLSSESIQRNSTEELIHGLTAEQRAASRKEGRGKHPERAGTRALSPTSRRQREDAESRRLIKRNAREAHRSLQVTSDTAQGEERARQSASMADDQTAIQPRSPQPNHQEAISSQDGFDAPDLSLSNSLPDNKTLQTSGSGGTVKRARRNEPESDQVVERSPKRQRIRTASIQSRAIPLPNPQGLQFTKLGPKSIPGALQLTRDNFELLLGYEPSPTDPLDTFDAQYDQIQAEFESRWERSGGEKVPKLIRIEPPS